jgi:hypothetical protein
VKENEQQVCRESFVLWAYLLVVLLDTSENKCIGVLGTVMHCELFYVKVFLLYVSLQSS